MNKQIFLLPALLSLLSTQLPAQMFYEHPEGKCSHQHTAKAIAGAQYVLNPQMLEYDVTAYKLDVQIENNTVYVAGNVTIEADVVVNGLDTFVVDLINPLVVDSVIINSVKLNSTHTTDRVFIPLPAPLNQGARVIARIYYHGTPPTSGFFAGITTDYNPGYNKYVTWTLSEPFNAREWWPCKQDLKDKADSAWIFITTSAINKAGSNGLLTAVTNMPNGKKRYEWKTRYPIAYYLISAAVADYMEYNIYAHPVGYSDSILIQNFIYNNASCLAAHKTDIDKTDDYLELMSELYGLYPFANEKYGHCLTELGGGMEHQTMTTLGAFNFSLNVHELSHMWWGDNVTCATWSDIWVNEGFATYSEYLATEALLSSTQAYNWLVSNHNYVMNQPGGSVYVPPAEAIYGNEWRIFSGRLSYQKGGAILHQIRFEMQNDSLFFETLKTFQQIYADSVATGLDFKQVCNTVSGLDFTDFFNQWYFGEGYPTHNIVWNQKSDTLIFTLTQTSSMPSVTPLFKMLMEFKVMTTAGDTLIRVYVGSNVSTHKIIINGTALNIIADPKEWVLDKVGSVIVGVEETEKEMHFTITPNPVADELHLHFSHTVKGRMNVEVYGINGSLVRSMLLEQGSNTVDVRSLAKGTYVIRVFDGTGTFSRKFIKD